MSLVVVVQQRAEKCTNKRGARAKLLFCLRPRRWILKSLICRRNCYHSNETFLAKVLHGTIISWDFAKRNLNFL